MNTISTTTSASSIAQRVHRRFACLSKTTLGALGLALTALAGRGLTFLVAGPAPLIQLVALLVLAGAALTLAVRARRTARRGGWNARLSGMAMRIGAIQTVFGLGALTIAFL